MNSITTLQRRIERMRAQAERESEPKTWAFILFNDQALAPEKQALIGQHDTVYIKRIILTHPERAA